MHTIIQLNYYLLLLDQQLTRSFEKFVYYFEVRKVDDDFQEIRLSFFFFAYIFDPGVAIPSTSFEYFTREKKSITFYFWISSF